MRKSCIQVYRFYQKLLEIKKNDPAAIYGKTREYDHENKRILAYSREYEGRKLFIMANFSKKETSYAPDPAFLKGKILLNNYEDLKNARNKVSLKPYQAVVEEV